MRAHVAALADGDARKALVLLDAALLDDGPASEDEVASTTPEAVEPWCPSHDAEPPSITSISPHIVPRKGGRVLVHVARCDAGYALIDGRRVAFDQITHVGGRLQAFVIFRRGPPSARGGRGRPYDGALSDAVAFGALVAYEAEDLEEEDDGRRAAGSGATGASDDEDEAVPESPSAAIATPPGVAGERARRRGRSRGAALLSMMMMRRRTPRRPTPPTRCPRPTRRPPRRCRPRRPSSPRKRPLWRPNPQCQLHRPRRAPMETEPAARRRRGRRRARRPPSSDAPRSRRPRRSPRRGPPSTPSAQRRRRAPRRRRRHASRAARRACCACYGGSAAVDRRRPRRGVFRARPARRGADAGPVRERHRHARTPARCAVGGACWLRRGSAPSRPSTTRRPCGPSSAARRRAGDLRRPPRRRDARLGVRAGRLCRGDLRAVVPPINLCWLRGLRSFIARVYTFCGGRPLACPPDDHAQFRVCTHRGSVASRGASASTTRKPDGVAFAIKVRREAFPKRDTSNPFLHEPGSFVL